MRRQVLSVLVLLAGAALIAYAQQNQNFDNVEVHVLPVQGNVYMLVGAGGNITVRVGQEGILVVDTQFAPLAPKVLSAIRALSKAPIRYVVNTHYHPDHTGGNVVIRAAGKTITGGNVEIPGILRKIRRPVSSAGRLAPPTS